MSKPHMHFCPQLLALFLCFCLASLSARAELRVPAHAAYVEPDPESLEVSEPEGVPAWTNTSTKLVWFGQFTQKGTVECSLALHLPEGAEWRLRLTVGEKSTELTAKGSSSKTTEVAFGSFEISAAGFQRLALEPVEPMKGPGPASVQALVLHGPAASTAHFNLKKHRNAASVHLFYPVEEGEPIDAMYCEVTAETEPVWTFYMACGWHRGYFGMQVNSPTERRIIFSVWDSGNEAVDRDKVGAEDRVQLVAKGPEVYAGDFGNEGTGGHSHLKFLWKTGQPQKFLVTAQKPDATHTIYSGFYFRPDKQEWMLIASWKAPKEKSYLRGLHSFSENFGGANGQLLRRARYGDQWAHRLKGDWFEITQASFSHDDNGKTNRLDRFMGVQDGQFFLSHGGYIDGFTKYGQRFTRAPLGKAPVLPKELLPAE